LAALSDAVALLQSQRIPGVVVGGIAASILGRARATQDIDLLVWLDEARWEALLRAAASAGFEPRIPDCLEFARRSRVLLLRHRAGAVDVDITFGALPFERRVVDRSTLRDVGTIRVPLPTPEDLIVMKAVAHRARDLADIEGLLDANPDLDRAAVERQVKEFADSLEAPDLLSDLRALLDRRGR
jgi:hypothetical protein